jgi:hypothetical protein
VHATPQRTPAERVRNGVTGEPEGQLRGVQLRSGQPGENAGLVGADRDAAGLGPVHPPLPGETAPHVRVPRDGREDVKAAVGVRKHRLDVRGVSDPPGPRRQFDGLQGTRPGDRQAYVTDGAGSQLVVRPAADQPRTAGSMRHDAERGRAGEVAQTIEETG